MRILALVALLAMAAPASETVAVAVVVDRDNPRTEISTAELRAIWLGQQREWQDGSRVVALDLEAGTRERETFNAAVLEMDQVEVERYWIDQRMRGNGGTPRVAPTPGSVVKLVGRVKGAIGYVPLKAVDASVRVLRVEGVAPGRPGYPIEVK